MPVSIPADYGTIGNIYIDVDTGDFYGPKTSEGWPDTPFFTALTELNVDELTNNERFIHVQGGASSTWDITHALGGKPSVTIVDSADTVVHGEVRYNSTTSITVLFSTPFSGYAYLT